jgi:3-hydroxyisobutyrate dehydrogenase
VWNRSPEKARALEAGGAIAFTSPAQAVRGVEQLHLTLADDASVDAVLEPIADAIDATTWIVDHTTTAPTPTAERVERWNGRGKTFVHAPVFMGPANTREGTGFMLIAGERTRFDALEPLLQTMTGKVVYLGAEPGRAASFKLFGNLMILATIGGLADVNRFAHGVGVSSADAMPVRAKKIGTGDYSASFELAMARKDLRLMVEEAARHGVELAVVPAVAALFDAAIARGDGAQDASAAAKLDG